MSHRDPREPAASAEADGRRVSPWAAPILDAVFAATSIGVAQVDAASGRILRINPCLCRLLGFEQATLLGGRFTELAHVDDRSAGRLALQRLARGDMPGFAIEHRLMHSQGAVLRVLTGLSPIRTAPEEAVLGVLALVTDITRRRHAEEALAGSQRDLRPALDASRLRLWESDRTRRPDALGGTARAAFDEPRPQALHALLGTAALAGLDAQARERLRQLAVALVVGAVEEERQRLSRDLHDTLGQHLSVLTLGLQRVAQDPGCPAPLGARVAELQAAARRVEDEVGRISHELRPMALDELDLEAALRRHAASWSGECGVAVDVHCHGLRDSRFGSAIDAAVYRVAQEALTNVRKHAAAHRVCLILERRGGSLRLIIEDDGRGFDPAADEAASGRWGLGLRGMSERALLAGGQLQIESAPGAGTTLYLDIPLASRTT